MSGYTRHSVNDVDVQPVSITSIDLNANIAGGMTKNRTAVSIDISHHVGAIHVTPSIGDQWYIERYRGSYRLKSQIPFNNVATTITPVQGQTQLGSGKGPVQLHGTQINANAPLRLTSGNSPLPDPTTVDAGSLAYNGSVPVYSDGTSWIPLTTGGAGAYYVFPDGGIPATDMTSGVQNALELATTAFQQVVGGIPASALSAGVQTNLTKASTALQNIPASSVGLSQLQTTGTPGPTTFLSGTMTWTVPSGATGLQSLLDGLTGIPGALVSDVTTELSSLITALGGSGSTLTALKAILTDLPQGNIAGLASSLGALLSTATYTSMLTTLTSSLGGAGSTVSSLAAALGNIPQVNINGLGIALSALLSTSTWTSYLAAVNGALTTGGADVASFVAGLRSIPQVNISGLGIALSALLSVSTWTTFLSNANTALATSGSDLTHLITGLGAIPRANIIGLVGYLTNLTSGGVLALSGLASGAIPAGITLAGSALTGLATGIGSWLTAGGGLPSATSATISQVTSLGGYLTNLTSGGVLALAGLASGALPAGVTAAISNVTSLSGYLAHLTSGGVLDAAAGLSGAISSAVTAGGASDLVAMVTAVLGATENTFPLVLPFTFSAPTTLANFGSYVNNLVTQQQHGELKDLLYNSLVGNSQVNWVTGVSKGVLAQGVATFQAQASAAEAAAVGALGTIESLLTPGGAVTVPGGNVSAALGPAALTAGGLAGEVQQFVDAGVQGLNNTSTTGNPIAAFANAISGVAAQLGWNPLGSPPANSTSGIARTMNAFINDLPITGPLWEGIDPTGDSTFNAHGFTGGSVTTVNVTQTGSLIGYIATPHGGVKESVAWLGGQTTGITAIVLNVYLVNQVSNGYQFLGTSGNILSKISSNSPPQWCYWNFDASAYINATQGNVYAVEMQVFGSGTYTVAGITSPLSATPHKSIPGVLAASRAVGPPVFDTAVPSAAFSTSSGNGTFTWTHDFAKNIGEAAVVSIWASASAPTASVTIGGVAMTLLGSVTNSVGAGDGVLWLFGLLNPPTGPQTIALTLGGTISSFTASSFSYSNVSGFGVFASNAGTVASGNGGTIVSAAVAAAANQTVLQMFGGLSQYASGTVVSPGQYGNYWASTVPINVRATSNYVWSSGVFWTDVIVGDAPGAATTTFNAVLPTGATAGTGSGVVTNTWASVAIPLIGGVPQAPPYIDSPNIPVPSASVPFFIMSGSTGTTVFTPDLIEFTTSGAFDPTLFAWANHFDIITCGGGGGGQAGGAWQGSNGGGAGVWAATTIDAAQAGSQPWTIVVGSGGSGGVGTSVAGNQGSPSYVQHPTLGTLAFAPDGAGGFGATGFAGGGGGGYSGNEIYSGPSWIGQPNTYFGGGPGAGGQGSGAQPGGGGGGGNSVFLSGTYVEGGNGGPGIVYILAYT